MQRQALLLFCFIMIVGFVALWQLPKRLPFESPIDQALKTLTCARNVKEKIQALAALNRTIKEMTLTDEDKRKVIAHLAEVAERNREPKARSASLALLWELGERGSTMTNLLTKAIRQSPQEAQLALELLPQVADAEAWQRFMDAFEKERDPVLRDRLLRLLRKTPKKHLQELCRRLGHNPSVWETVAAKLSEANVSELIQWAVSDDEALQKGALRLLIKFVPSPDEAAKLSSLLLHKDDTVRLWTAAIFSQSPSPKAVTELRAALNDKPEVAAMASSALLKLGALKPDEGRKLLQKRYATLRAQGALALARSKDEKDLQLLTRSLSDPDLEVVRNSAVALAAKGERGLNIVLKAYRAELRPERRAAMLTGISGVHHPKVIRTLVQALRLGDWKERGVALMGLMLQRDKAMPELEKLLHSSVNDRLVAVEAMKAIGTEPAMRLLLRVARNDKDKRVRREAIWALSSYGFEGAIPLLSESVRKGDKELAEDAAIALTRYGKLGRNILREFLKSDKPETYQAAMKALALIGDEMAKEALQKQAESPDPNQRLQALQSLARSGDEKAIDELISFLDSEDPLMRLKARAGLFGVGLRAVPKLLKALESESPKVRAEAATILGALKVTSAREKLADLTDDPDPKVQEAARQALARLETME